MDRTTHSCVPEHIQNNPHATVIELIWAQHGPETIPTLFVDDTTALLQVGDAIYCDKLYGNGVIRRVTRMEGLDVIVVVRFGNKAPRWPEDQELEVGIPTELMILTWAERWESLREMKRNPHHQFRKFGTLEPTRHIGQRLIAPLALVFSLFVITIAAYLLFFIMVDQ